MECRLSIVFGLNFATLTPRERESTISRVSASSDGQNIFFIDAIHRRRVSVGITDSPNLKQMLFTMTMSKLPTCNWHPSSGGVRGWTDILCPFSLRATSCAIPLRATRRLQDLLLALILVLLRFLRALNPECTSFLLT